MSETDWFAGIRSKPRIAPASKASSAGGGKRGNIGAAKVRQGGPGGVTPARDQLTAFIMTELRDTGRVPTLDQCAAELGWQQTSSVRDCLRKCVADGHLRQSVVDAVMARRT